MNPRPVDESRFVSLISPPPGHDAAAAFALMIPFLDSAQEGAVNRFGVPPCIVATTLDAHAADAAVRAITSLGGDAFAPSLADIAALGPTLKIKHLELTGNGTLLAEFWRADPIAFEPASIQVLVRVSLGKKPAGFGTPDADRAVDVARVGAIALDIAIDGGTLGYHGYYAPTPSPPLKPTAILSERLDIHLTTGEVLQIDGGKFGFAILGSLRGHSDKANIDAMIDLLEHLAGHAVVDNFFGNFKPPPGIDRLRLPQSKLNKDNPAFAFYSRWAALMYRHVMS